MKLIFLLFHLLMHNTFSFKQKDVKKIDLKNFEKKFPNIDYPINENNFINYYSQMIIYPLKTDPIEYSFNSIASKPLDESKVNIYNVMTEKIFYEQFKSDKSNKLKITTKKVKSIIQSNKFWIPLLGLLYIFISYFLNYTNIPCCINLV